MRGTHLLNSLLSFAFILLFAGCNECVDCEQYDNEPYVRMRFFEKATLASVDVAILEINGLEGSDVIWYQDTTNEFVLPLSMNDNESAVSLIFSYPADSTMHSGDMLIMYERSLERTVENYVRVDCFYTEITDYSFDSLGLVCKDTTGLCKSNDAVINIYF